jgi:dTDP-4-amino-4,6-dideoxygalactose transaminase
MTRVVAHRIASPWVEPWEVARAFATDPSARLGAVAGLEAAIVAELGGGHAVVTSSLRAGLGAVLAALDLPPGSPAWMPVNTYSGLPAAVRAAGLRCAYADVGMDHQIDPEDLERRLRAEGGGPGVLLATHMLGMPCDLPRLLDICARHRLTPLEDCAHAFGVDVDGTAAGLRGTAGLFSFQGRKAINTLTGGAVVTRDAALAARVRGLVGGEARDLSGGVVALALVQAAERAFFFAPAGYWATRRLFQEERSFEAAHALYGRMVRAGRGSARSLTTLQALLGTAQVKQFAARRRRLADRWADYDAAVARCPGLTPPPGRAGSGHGRYMYVVRAPDPARFAEALWRRGVGTALGEGLVPCLAEDADDYPVARALRRQALQLPFSDGLADADFAHVAAALVDAWPEARG